MAKIKIDLRIDEADLDQIKQLAVEGNVSQWIRLLIKEKLEQQKKSP